MKALRRMFTAAFWKRKLNKYKRGIVMMAVPFFACLKKYIE